MRKSSLIGLIALTVAGSYLSIGTTQSEENKNSLSVVTKRKDNTQMVRIPAGPFVMGAQIEPGFDFKTLRIKSFYIDRFEVTNKLYGKFVRLTSNGYTSSYSKDKRFNPPSHPVVGISWFDSKAYCLWAGKRLPTEAEWEKAARGSGPNKYNPLNGRLNPEIPLRNLWANFRPIISLKYDFFHADPAADGFRFTAPVGSFPNETGPHGIYDMAGNVWEWVADVYPTRKVRENKEKYKGLKIQRGGSWLNLKQLLDPTYRRWSNPYIRSDSATGFRCAKSNSPKNQTPE